MSRPDVRQVRDLAERLLTVPWAENTSEARIALSAAGFHPGSGDGEQMSDGDRMHELVTSGDGVAGHWVTTARGALQSIVLMMEGTRQEIEWLHAAATVEVSTLLDVPKREFGTHGAPRLSWETGDRVLGLDAYWADPRLSVLMLSVERARWG
ncbi:hypothetical protein [Paramicrobacterium humi]|uniref:hypothetical protein n=1 Tax=Paramicrobacterium humi TaxID=640635 RepID=UPI000B80B6BA|nr:hypothetical protein [Microbacterium humi]